MNTSALKKFAQQARRDLIDQVGTRLKVVLAQDSAARRENSKAVAELEKQIAASNEEQVVDRVAYIWFNRFCALRFMDANRYTPIGIVSPAEGQTQPAILAEAKMGHMDSSVVPAKVSKKVNDILSGSAPSPDPQSEAYRLLLVAACNYFHSMMPFLFERIVDYTELLLPDDLLSENSVLASTLEAMDTEACEDVEVIGWLYQFYISEKKDEVFDGLKKNKKITPENIPAATQLFTPNWIVRYLVENSLGRLWMLNRPDSKLIEQMEYYIKPEQPEEDYLDIASPEEIKVCDPACGSGHMLVYAFDLLYSIYEEEGYDPSEIPERILRANLYGIEIDERAGELAAFALTMKARSRQRTFFRKKVQPNICVLENIEFAEGELKEYMETVGRDLFTAPLQATLHQFKEAKSFGALIRPEIGDLKVVRAVLDKKDLSGNLFLAQTHQKVLQTIEQADYLQSKYQVVVANPPYMGAKGMNGRLSQFAECSYPESKTNLFSMFMERIMELGPQNALFGMMTPFAWMYISNHESVRAKVLFESSIISLVQLDYDSYTDAKAHPCAFVLCKKERDTSAGVFVYLEGFKGAELQPQKCLEAIKNVNCEWRFERLNSFFRKIPGAPLAFWAPEKLVETFARTSRLDEHADCVKGLDTCDNERFVRKWHEVSVSNIELEANGIEETNRGIRWYPYDKGGFFRKWYGNKEHVVDWQFDGQVLRNLRTDSGKMKAFPRSTKYYFKQGITFGAITSADFSARLMESSIFGGGGNGIFTDDPYFALGILNSDIVSVCTKVFNPTANILVGDLVRIPYPKDSADVGEISELSRKLVEVHRFDWNSSETSWGFQEHAFVGGGVSFRSLSKTWRHVEDKKTQLIVETEESERRLNELVLQAYGLTDSASLNKSEHKVTLNEMSVTKEAKAFLSYSVGCMMGRYALDKPGLILANQGETFEDYLKQIPDPSFPADDDNVIPMLDEGWFTDDITERFYEFLKVTFGKEHFEENLKFIEDAIGKDVRKYFLRDFYKDHVKMYKKRPIYWLLSSPKGSFQALIYMHRYKPDTISTVLNGYLKEFRTKLAARKQNLEQVEVSVSASQGEKTKALKEIEKLNKILQELEDYERDILYPLAAEQIEIDLDDGVKVNYNKFGEALQKVPGLSE